MTSKSKTFLKQETKRIPQKEYIDKLTTLKLKTCLYRHYKEILKINYKWGEMFATYLINKGLVSRLSEKSKNQKEKLGLMKIRPIQQTDISQKEGT